VIAVQEAAMKGEVGMDQRDNTNDYPTLELNKALRKSKPRKNLKMSEAELRMKNQGKKI